MDESEYERGFQAGAEAARAEILELLEDIPTEFAHDPMWAVLELIRHLTPEEETNE